MTGRFFERDNFPRGSAAEGLSPAPGAGRPGPRGHPQEPADSGGPGGDPGAQAGALGAANPGAGLQGPDIRLGCRGPLGRACAGDAGCSGSQVGFLRVMRRHAHPG